MRRALAVYIWCAAQLAALPAHAASPGLTIEARISPPSVYVGQQARLTLRLLRAPGAPHGSLVPPELGDAALLTPFGPAQVNSIVRGNRIYQAVELHFILVPSRAGPLAVPRAGFEPAHGEHGNARGPHLTLDVRPIPPGAAEPWLPARGVTLEERWSRDPQALAAGMPVTRTLVIRADGLAAERLPRLALPATSLLRVRTDRPELSTRPGPDGLEGQSVQRFVLIPTGDGEIEMPPLSINWWDLGADAPRSANLAARSLTVHPAPVAAAPPETPPLLSERAELRWIVSLLLVVSAALLVWQLRYQTVRDAINRLREACLRKDPRAARAALAEWWTLVRPNEPVPLLSSMGAAWGAPAREQLASLDAALYANRSWDGAAFWNRVRPCLRARVSRRAVPSAPVAPFFKLQPRANMQSSILRSTR